MRLISSTKNTKEISRIKLKAKNLRYFDLDFKSEHNNFIINSKRYIYY